MLNPSTADATLDDPTIRRCIGFAQSWGFHRLDVVNLFAMRETNPAELKKYMDPVGPRNNAITIDIIRRASLIVCAWGAHPFAKERATFIRALLGSYRLHHLGLTASGAPRHPLYLKKDVKPIIWK